MPAKYLTYSPFKKWGAALLLSCALSLPLSAPVQADQVGLDAVTRQVMEDAFIALRFTALALEEDDEAGQALEGLVRAMLSRGEFKGAVKEANRIDDDIWFARAMISISHYLTDNSDDANALEYLSKGLARIDKKNTALQADETRRVIALKRAIIGDLQKAEEAARQIHDQIFRIDTLQMAASAHQESAGYDKASMKGSAVVLKQAFFETAKLESKEQSVINILIGIGESQVKAGDIKGAKTTYYYARDRAISGHKQGRFTSYAKLASALTYIDDHAMAMQVLRMIDEGGNRGIALSAVAKSMAGAGNVDAALPLFTLAFEQTQQEIDLGRRYAIYAQILDDQTSIGRLADAFTTAGAIKDRYLQSLALLRMGENLIDQGKYEEAHVLVDYIPYVGMRALIFAETAVFKSIDVDAKDASIDPVKVSSYLIQALEDTGFDPSLDHLPSAIQKVLLTQLEFGDAEMDHALYERAAQLAYLLPTASEQVDALTYLATAQANREFYELANKTISAAWRIAWQNKYEPIYANALAKITQSQIAVRDILSAFDTAARVPKAVGYELTDRAPDGSFRAPRFDALTSVAAASAQMGDTELAIRAARQIRHPPAQAAALAAVAVAIASPEKPLREIVGIGPTDLRPYDMLTVQFSNSDDNEAASDESIDLNKMNN